VLSGLALGSNSTVYLSGLWGAADFVVSRLSQNPEAKPLQLVCVTNAAGLRSYGDPVAGGELISLFGQGLGPAEGTQPLVTLQTGFPSELAKVQATFSGTAGPLLYVQDNQISR
jgi:hypothetical protein